MWKDKNLLQGSLASTISEYHVKWNEICHEAAFRPSLEEERHMTAIIRKNFKVISGYGAEGAEDRFKNRFDIYIKE